MIPKIIIQTWKTNNLPNKWCKQYVKRLRSTNSKFKYMFFTDKDIDSFIRKNYPQYYKTFKNFKFNIQRIDFFRYLAVYHYGGFYFDIDYQPLKPLEPLCKHDCVFPMEYQRNGDLILKKVGIKYLLGNYAFGAKKKHPFIKQIIDNIVKQRIPNNKIPKHDQVYVFYTTGPVLVTMSYADYKKKITILEPKPFKIFHFGQYGMHRAFGTWKK